MPHPIVKPGRQRAEYLRRNTTPYSDDPVAQFLVSLYPHGLTLQAVATYLGLSRERVRQIEQRARMRLHRAGYGEALRDGHAVDNMPTSGVAMRATQAQQDAYKAMRRDARGKSEGCPSEPSQVAPTR